ncbi:subclass B1 metallo-beta-lactamase [Seonamhaeicola marinus]|uniref:beta-lactamase n=1 Tax=Seonamhaeicola marinus TaxID=1912246 RepID=A0A5D0H4W7_9FLAO|nr:subclass B1 metallo-beta-lactamase [Seonamhaeicola marinus]TYA66020.1 subclass B1 metallo-beta-lactamase [Seonamhaeicola marinus]
MKRPFLFLLFTLYFGNLLLFSQNVVFKSDKLKIKELKPNVFQHISFLKTRSFGMVGCNGMIYFSKDEAIVFDTPVSNEVSDVLIHWIQETMNKKIVAVVPTHFHNDCLAGLASFHKKDIPSYANELTIKLAQRDSLEIPKKSFNSVKKIKVGKNQVIIRFFGEGHTKDNVVGYLPNEATLFGGCLVKSIGAGKGYLGDANVNEWSNTISNIKRTFPELELVIPGHGKSGDTALLDFTFELFEN